MRSLYPVILLLVISLTAVAQTTAPRPRPLQATARPLFIENRGQWRPEVRYLARLHGNNVWVTNDGITYDFFKTNRATSQHTLHSALPPILPTRDEPTDSTRGHVVRMRFEGRLDAPQAQGSMKSSTYFNYFIGNDSSRWRSHIPGFAEASLDRIYNGISARLYVDDGSLRYDLITEPGADLDDVVMAYDGTDDMTVNECGDLVLKTSLGDVIQRGLYAYQMIDGKQRPVECRFVLKGGNRVGFAAHGYIASLPLVVDPLVYSTFIGGSNEEYPVGIAVDRNGSAIIIGGTASQDYPTTPGAYLTTYPQHATVYVSKFKPDGDALIYSTFISSTLNLNNLVSDLVHLGPMAVDTSGAVVFTAISGPGYPTTQNAYSPTCKGVADIVVTKLDSNGANLIFSTYLGGSQGPNGIDGETVTSIVLDQYEWIYLTGVNYSSDFPTTASAYSTPTGLRETFVTKLKPDGSAIGYSTIVPNGEAIGITVDNLGNAYITGTCTPDRLYPTTSKAYDTTTNGTNDIFVTKLNPYGQKLIYSTFLGGSKSEFPISLAIDASGAAYVFGSTASVDFPTTPGAFNRTFNPLSQNYSFVAKLDSVGRSLKYSTLLATTFESGTWGEHALCVRNGEAIIYQLVDGTSSYPTTPDAFATTIVGSHTDIAITRLNTFGTKLIYSTFFGGSGDEYRGGIAIDSASGIYLTGSTSSTDLPTTPEAYDIVHHSPRSFDGFVAKFDFPLCVATAEAGNDTSICPGQTLRLIGSGYGAPKYQWIDLATNIAIADSQNVTVAPLSTSSYRLRIYDGKGCENFSDIKVSVLPRPDAPLSVDTTICSYEGPDILSIYRRSPPGTTLRWFDSATGGTKLFTGNSFTTPGLSASKTYYIETIDTTTGCWSQNRTPVTVTINQAPSVPSLHDTAVCLGEPLTLSIPLPIGVIPRWFDSASGGTRLFAGNDFSPLGLTSTTTFFVETEDQNTGCISAKRFPITVAIHNRPTLDPIDLVVCSGEPAVVKISPPIDVAVRWFTSSSPGGSPVATGTSFTSDPLNASTSFFIELVDTVTGCSSADRILVSVDVRPRPQAPTAQNDSTCFGQPAVLSASAPQGTDLRWFDSASGGTFLGSGSFFTTPQLTLPTTFFVEAAAAVGSDCISKTRTPVTVSIIRPPDPPSASDALTCFGASATLSVSGPTHSTFRWFDSASGGSLLHTGDTFETPPVSDSTIYFVETVDQVTGCSSAIRTPVTVSIGGGPLPLISGQNAACINSSAIPYSVGDLPGHTYLWSVSSNGSIASGQGTPTIAVDWSNAGMAWVRVRETDPSTGCFKDSTLRVEVSTSLKPAITPHGSTTLCLGDTLTLDAGAGYATYLWSSGQTTQSIRVAEAGTYSISVSDGGECSGTSEDITVTVNPLPQMPVIQQNGNRLNAATTGNVIAFRWRLNGQSISTGTTRSIIADSDGDYTVEITDANGCRRRSDPYHYSSTPAVASASVEIVPEMIEGEAGEIVTIPIRLRESTNLAQSGVGKFHARLRFDKTMLMPLGTPGSIDNMDRIVDIDGWLRSDNDTLAQLRCVVLLGEREYSPISIDTFEWNNVAVTTSTQGGVFHLTGICKTGIQRLVTTTSALKIAIHPNPAGNQAEVSIDLTEDGATRVDLTDATGRIVTRLFDGTATHGRLTLPIETDTLGSGSYYLLLRTPTDVIVERLEVRK